MADTLTKKLRSHLMSCVRQTGTDIELLMRKRLWGMGWRYRLKNKLPGRPDIVFVSKRVAIFVDGCFWHGCPVHGTFPKTNKKFWLKKFRDNKNRDLKVDRQLSMEGWKVLRFWEHDVKKDPNSCCRVVSRVLRSRESN